MFFGLAPSAFLKPISLVLSFITINIIFVIPIPPTKIDTAAIETRKYLIEDVNGDTCGLTLWADDYERYRGALKDGLPIKAICKVNSYLDQKDLALSNLERIYGRDV